MRQQKKILPKRNERIKRIADDIRNGSARLDRIAVRLNDAVRCGICNREGRTMVRVSYENGNQDYLGKTCARYVMDYMNSDQSV